MLTDDIDVIAANITLPNGVIVPNRLVKAATEEGIGYGGGLPTRAQRCLYKRWAEGGWGAIITGNVQIDPRHLATCHDRTIFSTSALTIASYAQLHSTILSSVPTGYSEPLTLMQISHPGLQSSSTLGLCRLPWARAVAPCSARPDTGNSAMGWLIGRLVWPLRSRRLDDVEEWLQIVEGFVRAAQIAEKSGWKGVQVHSAHGYLLAEYLSPLTNPDPSPLPGVPWTVPLRLHLLYLILIDIHGSSDPKFVKSVKINCSDFVQGGLDEEQSTELIKEIISWKLIDILEISGGNYSSPAFASLESISNPTPSRQSLFAHFTTSLLPQLPVPPNGPAIMLTGGLHIRDLIASSLRNRACDLVGIGRPACVKPTLPVDIILNRELEAEQTGLGSYKIKGGEAIRYIFGGGKSAIPSTPGKPAVSSYTESGDNLDRSKGVAQGKQGIPLVGAGISTTWHEWQLCRIGRGVEPDMDMSWLWGGLIVEGLWWGLLRGGPWGWWTK